MRRGRTCVLVWASVQLGCAAPASRLEPSGATQKVAEAPPTVLTEAQQARDASLAGKARSFLDAFINLQPQLLPDARVVFLSNRDGIPALYVGDERRPTEPPRRLPGPDERVRTFTVLPDHRTILFASDVKANGLFRIFKVDVDGSGLEDLTPGEPLARGRPWPARKDGGLFAYGAHRLEDPAERLLLQRVGEPPREIWRAPTTGAVEGLSPDGKRVLFVQSASDTRQILLEVDAATGRPRRLWPTEGTATISAAAYSSEGDAVFVSLDRLGEPPQVLLVDRLSGRPLARYEETESRTASLGFLVPSPAGDRVLIGMDAGNRVRLRVHDAQTLAVLGEVRTGGVPAQPAFDADGGRFAMGVASPEAPPDIVAVDTKTLRVTPLRADPRPDVLRAGTLSAEIVEIRAFDGATLPLNLYRPANTGTRRLPTLVSVHGGPSGSAYLRWSPAIAFWASMGFAVIEPNIRGSTGFGLAWQEADNKEKRADAMRDMESINAWARQQPWCDDNRLVVGGISYGGYMTLLALTRQPRLWAAGIDGSGMSDLRTMERNEEQSIRVYDEEEFGKPGPDDAVLEEWSPLKDVSKVVAPLFVYQGVHDPITPRSEADQVVSALRGRGVPVEYMVLEDEGHGIVRRDNTARYLARSYRFLAEHLGLQ
jgi:dipeptidyl aminopeptidase/acylaminoacyl peptidase